MLRTLVVLLALGQLPGGTPNGIFEAGIDGAGVVVGPRLDLDTKDLFGDYSADSNTYIHRSGADEWTIVSGGANTAICDATYCTLLGLKISTAAGIMNFTGATSGEIQVDTGDLILDIAGDSVSTHANKDNLIVNIPVTGTDNTAHTIALQVDGDAGISIAATGDGAAHVGVKTISIGTTSEANVIHVGGATALVDVTDAHWSVTEAGALVCVSGNFSDGNVTNVGDIAVDSVTADATSGGITLGGTGAATTESVKLQFGETGNIVDVTTATGVTDITATGIDINTTTEVSAENLVSTDDADINDSLVCGDLTIDEAAGTIAFTGATSATIYQSDVTSNVDTPNMSILAASSYAQASTAGYKIGGDNVVASGIGSSLATAVSNVAGNVTVTITVNHETAVALVGSNPIGANQFALGTDDTAPQLAATATNLAAAINAHATLGTYLTATPSTAYVYVQPKENCFYLLLATSAAPRISVTQAAPGTMGVYGNVRLGKPGAGPGTATANGDVYIAGSLEADSAAYFDGTLSTNSHLWTGTNYAVSNGNNDVGVSMWCRQAAQTPDTGAIAVGSTARSVLFCDVGDVAYDFAHAAQTNPTIFGHSANQSTTEWWSLTHDQTQGVIATGAGDLDLRPITGKVKITADDAANHGFVLDGTTTHDTLTLRNAADGAAGALSCGAITLANAAQVACGNDAGLWFGSGDTTLSWRTSQTPDTLVLGVGTTSRGMLIAENADYTYDWAVPLNAYPWLGIMGPTQQANSGVFLGYTDTMGVLSTRAGNISLQPQGAVVHAPKAIATDAAPAVTIIASQPVLATTAVTATTGANIVLAPSPGSRVLTGVTKASTTGDTLTFAVQTAGVVTSTVKTEGDGTGGTWDCDGAASDAECVCNLYTLLTGAGAITGVTVARTDGTCSDEKLAFSITPGAASGLTVTASDGTNMVVASGTDGNAVLANCNRIGTGAYLWSSPGTSNFAFGPNCTTYTSTAYMGSVNATNATLGGYVSGGRFADVPQTITCATSGDGNHSTCGGAQTISSNVVQLVCEDTDGCTLTLTETNNSSTSVHRVTLIGPAANHVDIADSAGVLELDGGAAFAMVANDTLDMVYAPASLAWVERNRHTDL